MQPYEQTIFLHGLEGSSQGFKATWFRKHCAGVVTPDFHGSLDERMAQLTPILATQPTWTIVGSSFGGLMGALVACQSPQQVRQLILLAPALHRSDFTDCSSSAHPISLPVTIYHGSQDSVVPMEPVKAVAERAFANLTFHVVDDEHSLRNTFEGIDWVTLLSGVS